VSKDEATDILKVVVDSTKTICQSFPPSTSLVLLQEEESQQCIVSFSERLDDLMGGGVPVTKITEFCGVPGIGKTQMW